MLPTITRLTSLDVYRDGGSLSVSFDGSNTFNYTLFLRINLVHDGFEIRKLGYHPPVIEQYKKVSRISPITGLESFSWETHEQSISWEEAQQIIKVITPMIDGFQSGYLYVFPELCEIVKNRGALAEP